MDSKELKQEVETKFHLALTLGIFFPTFLIAFLDGAEMAKKQINSIGLSWTANVSILLLSYVLFAAGKNKLPDWILKWLNRLLLTNIGSFVFPILFLSTTQADKHFSNIAEYIYFIVSIFGQLITPSIMMILAFIGILIYYYKITDIIDTVKLLLKKIKFKNKNNA